LFAQIGAEYTDDPDLPIDKIIDLKKRAFSLTSYEEFKIPKAKLPDEYHPVMKGSLVHQYLLCRGLTDDDIEFYQIGEGTEFYGGWAIIPSFDRLGKCEHWVARNTDPDWDGRKYDNPQAARKYHIPFLRKALESSKDGSVILCEGVFSAIVAGRSACATLGKFVSNNQIAALERASVRLVRICLDGDAKKEALKLAQKLLDRSFEVTLIDMPIDLDPADMGRGAFYDHLSSNERIITGTDLLRIRLERV